MSRNGSGNYSLPAGNPVGTGTTISSTVHNATMADVASALTASIAKDGQTTPSANLPMGTYRHTGVGSGTARDQYAAVAQIQDGGAQYVGSVSGVDTITGSLTPAIAAYATGMVVVLPPAGANTGAATLALNGLAAKSIVNPFGSTLTAGSLRATNPAVLVYNGTSFVLVSAGVATGSFTGTLTGMSGATTGTVNYRVSDGVVTLWIDSSITGTSNTNAMTMTGLPAAVQPGTTRRTMCVVTDGAGNKLAMCETSASGTATFYLANDDGGSGGADISFQASGFQTSAGKGLSSGWTVTYPL